LLRVGNYAAEGTSNISIIDADSFWIDGYFEETKLARLSVGDRAEAKLMGYSSPIIGHVATVTRGVSVSNAAAATQGLPNVDPVYTWVRLAQRVPVRIAIDKVPPGVPLVSGLTATLTIRSGKDSESRTLFQRVRTVALESFFGLFDGRGLAAFLIIMNPSERTQDSVEPVAGPTQSKRKHRESMEPTSSTRAWTDWPCRYASLDRKQNYETNRHYRRWAMIVRVSIPVIILSRASATSNSELFRTKSKSHIGVQNRANGGESVSPR
jgi:hypothetical protein